MARTIKRFCLKWLSWPLQSRKRAVVVSVTLLMTGIIFYLEFREDSESLSEKFRREFDERMMAAESAAAKETTEPPDKDDDYDYEEEEQILFDKLNPNEISVDHDIFFFVTTFARDLTSREAWDDSIESAARLHPGRKIFVLFMIEDVVEVLDSRTLSFLVSYENVMLRHIKIKDYFYHPSMKEWLLESNFHMLDSMSVYLSHALAYIFLFKFGGTVLSFDYLITEQIGQLGQFMSRCDEDAFDPFPMSVTSRHPILEDLLDNFGDAFSKGDSHSTGSDLLTRRIKKHCRVNFVRELHYKECKMMTGIKVLPTFSFCPIEADRYWTLFDPVRSAVVRAQLSDFAEDNGGTGALGVRLWLDHSGGLGSWGQPGDEAAGKRATAYYELAEKACPLTTQTLAEGHF